MVDGPLPGVWYRRDFPVLIELVRRFDRSPEIVYARDLPAALAMPDDDVQSALHWLRRKGLIDATVTPGMGHHPVLAIRDVSAEAAVLTGLHPSGDDDLDALINVIRQAVDQTSDPEEKSRLRRAASALGDASSEVMKLALAAYIAARIPG